MTKQNELQNNINRENAYIDYVKNSENYTELEKEEKIKKAQAEVEKYQLELLKEIEVESEKI